MLYVKTLIKRSNIHGIGLFAAQDIHKGTLIWKFDPGIDIFINKETYKSLTEIGKRFFDQYGYWSEELGGCVCASDNHRFTNHSTQPNVGTINAKEGDDGQDVALREIKSGEELTVDYRIFGENPERK